MSEPFSKNPYAPKIPYDLYFREKATFAGILIGAILYGTRGVPCPLVRLPVLTSFIPGMVIVLFFKCMAALLGPIYRNREGVKWGLVFFTVVMFAVDTVGTTMNLNVQSDAYINNREFPGITGKLPPGPLGYRMFISSKTLGIVPNIMFNLSNWLADGLLVSFSLNATFTRPGI